MNTYIGVKQPLIITARMNSFIYAKLAMKKLRLVAKKCFVMHIGNEHEDLNNIKLCFDGWNVKTVESYSTDRTESEETLMDYTKEISHIDSKRYLGQSISSDSKNTLNLKLLRNIGIWIQNRIVKILEKRSYYFYFF